MRRYHIKVFTEPSHWQRLEALTEEYNSLKWGYSQHCLDNIKSRAVDLEDLLKFIKGLRLQAGQIFEYYLDDRAEPIKVCYRIPYMTGVDIILVISKEKNIITIYINSRTDNHITLKENLYIRG